MRTQAGEAVVEVTTTYHARAERGERFWLIYVPEVDRWTQARRYSEIEETARDLVAVMEDVDPESFDVQVEVALPVDVAKHLRYAEDLRAQEAQARREANHEYANGVRTLTHIVGSQSEAARVLGITKQRVSQYING